MLRKTLIPGALLLVWLAVAMATLADTDDELPELEEVNAIAAMARPPLGVIFTIREFDEDALEWVLPRVERYIAILRGRIPGIHLAMMSHGDELAAASIERRKEYPAMHRRLQRLVRDQGLVFHICNTAAGMMGLGEDDFPDYVNVVPFGPAQVQDYLAMGYELIDLELTW